MAQASLIAVESVEGVAIGRVTAPTFGPREAPLIEQEVGPAADAAGGRLVLDLTEVRMMGSMGLGTLITLSKRCKQAGGALALFGLNDDIRGILKMSRLDKLLPIASDEAGALKKVR